MEAVIEYTSEKNDVVESILADHINEGWSETFGKRTVAQIDVPEKKIEELAKNGVKVNCDTPKLITLLRDTLKAKGLEDTELVINADSIDIKDKHGSWGYISLMDGWIFFQHGRHTPSIFVDNEDLPKWIEAYLTGFDEFDEIC